MKSFCVLLLILLVICANKGSVSSIPASRAFSEFTYDIYNKIVESTPIDKNFVFSPFSAYVALSGLLPGLDGDSREQLEALLRSTKFGDHVNEEMSRIINSVTSLNDNNEASLNLTNRIFIDRHFRLLKRYKNICQRDYAFTIKKLNFSEEPQRSRKKINHYIAKQTNQDIKNLLPMGSVSQSTAMILTNTLNMQAKWKYPFSKESTRLDEFRINNHTTTRTHFMVNKARCQMQFDHNLNSNFIELPLKDNNLTMIIIMPTTPGDFIRLERDGASNSVEAIINKQFLAKNTIRPTCTIEMPKFSVQFKLNDFRSMLKEMGVIDIFNPNQSDFSLMTPSDNLYVNNIQHGAAAEITEAGVKASAATSITLNWRSLPLQARIDRPFLFMIRHKPSGTTLFFGKVKNPRNQE